jgi:hypothetical protein
MLGSDVKSPLADRSDGTTNGREKFSENNMDKGKLVNIEKYCI